MFGRGQPPTEWAIKASARAAYLHALQWVVTGQSAYRNKAVSILDGWSANFRRFIPCDDEEMEYSAGACERSIGHEGAWVAAMFASSAEIIRHFEANGATVAWPEAERFGRMLEAMLNQSRVYVHPEVTQLFDGNNRGLSIALAHMAVGVFNDDRRLYDEGVALWRRMLPKVVVDTNGTLYEFEFRNDCSHYLFSVYALTQAAEIAFHQNDDEVDLYGESNFRVLKALGFVGRVLTGEITATDEEDGNRVIDCGCDEDNEDVATAPGLDLPYNHYKYRIGSTSSSLTKLEEAFAMCAIEGEMRPDDSRSMFLGWSTLTHGELNKL